MNHRYFMYETEKGWAVVSMSYTIDPRTPNDEKRRYFKDERKAKKYLSILRRL